MDFNELIAPDLVLLSQHDTKADANGEIVHLYEGLAVSIYSDDADANGRPDNLLANGAVERNREEGWAKHVRWCCRIDSAGIRHESDPHPGKE